jgi:hypothetical protein
MRILDSIRDGVYGNRPRDPLQTGDAERAVTPKAQPHAIDIENHLDSMPGADHLNWRTSIVDLMTLIGVDPTPEAREALAGELGYPGPAVRSQDMDNWLHTRVLADLAGEAPGEFGE